MTRQLNQQRSRDRSTPLPLDEPQSMAAHHHHEQAGAHQDAERPDDQRRIGRPQAKAWEGWNRAGTERTVEIDEVGTVHTWTEVLSADLPLVRFRSSWVLGFDGETLTSESTIRFRSADEGRADLAAAGFVVTDLLDAPARPEKELVFVAQRPATA